MCVCVCVCAYLCPVAGYSEKTDYVLQKVDGNRVIYWTNTSRLVQQEDQVKGYVTHWEHGVCVCVCVCERERERERELME